MSEEFVPGLCFSSVAQELWARIGQVGAAFEARSAQAAAAVGLSSASAWALIQLVPGEPISQKALAARLHCSQSTVVDPTDRLEARGLVVRQGHPTDRRMNVLVVTDQGRKVRDELLSQLFEPPEPLRRLTPNDQVKFRDVLFKVASAEAPAHEDSSR